MCITKVCEEPTAVGVWWRDDGEWKRYDDATAAAILRGTADRVSRVDLGTLASSKYGRGARYVVDLSTMQQINLATGFTRDVKVVNAPAAAATASHGNASDDHASVQDEIRGCQESIRNLKEMVLTLQAELQAVKLQASKNEARGVPARMHIANASRNRVPPGYLWGYFSDWESCDSASECSYDSLSEDAF